ncbi:MAG TPA: hypothetical protein PK280_15910 [Planctomycetota bacterium]|nr:hypothetical protein [Planctomycetota bacterium]
MSPAIDSTRARVLLQIERLASRLGALERQLTAAGPHSRPILEVGCNAIRQELSNLSRRLR